jgi:7-keto-8-aminopelargonate synthetase-like enzyme
VATAEELLQAFDEVLTDGARRRMMHSNVTDESLDGRIITIDGRSMVNYGSCSYLGLETHPAIKAGVIDAVNRYGTQFSSSRAYASSPMYEEAESLLGEITGRPTLITPSTTMGHVATMPTVIGSKDVLLLDHQVHNSVHTAAKLAQANGTKVELIRHSDLGTLERRLKEYRRSHNRVWYAADGLYSMYADFLPSAELNALMRRHDNLWMYVDDAHAASWTGRFGRGHALEHLDENALRRTVVALSLNKSFATAGGAITFPDEEMRRRVFTCGGPMIFSGPVQPPMLGGLLASARLHMTQEVEDRQQLLLDRIRLFNKLAEEEGLPLVSPSEAPIRFIGAGVTHVAYRLTERLRDEGLYINTAIFPAVPAKRCGARVTITAHHSDEDVRAVVEALAEHLPRALRDEGATEAELRRAFSKELPWDVRLRDISAKAAPAPRLVLETHSTIDDVDATEWDALLGERGSFDVNGLRVLEQTFGTPVEGEPENTWRFHYWLVRDSLSGRAVAATFFTTALWKDDMLSDEKVSREVESRRDGNPYFLTSQMVAMGSLITEGDHLYLDRTGPWRDALRLVLEAARAEEDAADAAAVMLRDLPDGDEELHEFLIGEGFIRVPILDTWHREIDFTTDEEFLAGLTSRARWQQKTNVLPQESRIVVEVAAGGDAATRPSGAELDALYALYRSVHARNLELNVYPLPRRVLDAIADTPGWELVVMRAEAGGAPIGFMAVHATSGHVGPVFCGLDYDYVASHGVYQQVLWQSIRAAQRNGATRVMYGMAAHLHKRRFGAVPTKRWVYVQPTDTYNMDLLSQIAETVTRG